MAAKSEDNSSGQSNKSNSDFDFNTNDDTIKIDGGKKISSMAALRSEFGVEDLDRLLCYLEGELQAREIVIATLKAEKAKHHLYQAKYGRIGLHDPLASLQRDSKITGAKDDFDEVSVGQMYDWQLRQLENLIESQKAAALRMRTMLASAERRHARVVRELETEQSRHAAESAQGDDLCMMLEKDRERLKQEIEFMNGEKRKMEKDMKKSSDAMEFEKERHKQIVLFLMNERRSFMHKLMEERVKVAKLTRELAIARGEDPDSGGVPGGDSIIGQHSTTPARPRLKSSLSSEQSPDSTQMRHELDHLQKQLERTTRDLASCTSENSNLKEHCKVLEEDLILIRQNILATSSRETRRTTPQPSGVVSPTGGSPMPSGSDISAGGRSGKQLKSRSLAGYSPSHSDDDGPEFNGNPECQSRGFNGADQFAIYSPEFGNMRGVGGSIGRAPRGFNGHSHSSAATSQNGGLPSIPSNVAVAVSSGGWMGVESVDAVDGRRVSVPEAGVESGKSLDQRSMRQNATPGAHVIHNPSYQMQQQGGPIGPSTPSASPASGGGAREQPSAANGPYGMPRDRNSLSGDVGGAKKTTSVIPAQNYASTGSLPSSRQSTPTPAPSPTFNPHLPSSPRRNTSTAAQYSPAHAESLKDASIYAQYSISPSTISPGPRKQQHQTVGSPQHYISPPLTNAAGPVGNRPAPSSNKNQSAFNPAVAMNPQSPNQQPASPSGYGSYHHGSPGHSTNAASPYPNPPSMVTAGNFAGQDSSSPQKHYPQHLFPGSNQQQLSNKQIAGESASHNFFNQSTTSMATFRSANHKDASGVSSSSVGIFMSRESSGTPVGSGKTVSATTSAGRQRAEQISTSQRLVIGVEKESGPVSMMGVAGAAKSRVNAARKLGSQIMSHLV